MQLPMTTPWPVVGQLLLGLGETECGRILHWRWTGQMLTNVAVVQLLSGWVISYDNSVKISLGRQSGRLSRVWGGECCCGRANGSWGAISPSTTWG